MEQYLVTNFVQNNKNRVIQSMLEKNELMNFGAIDGKVYHFDMESQTLMEETKPQSTWSYILLPFALYGIKVLAEFLIRSQIFEDWKVRLFSVLFLFLASFFPLQSYHHNLSKRFRFSGS